MVAIPSTGAYRVSGFEALGRFRQVTPELLAKRALLRRTDSKFLLHQRDLDGLLDRLADDYGVLCAGAQPVAKYRTLYFDTPEMQCFHDHRRGRRPRHKVRIRHYPDRSVSFLEIKTKRSEFTTRKHRAPRTYGDSELAPADRAFVAEHAAVPADELMPLVWTNFSRVTLVGLHTNERITIDSDLEFHADDKVTSLSGVIIVEVKQSPFCLRTPVMRALRDRGLRPASASKYCTATVFMRRGMRCNRLLPALRAIESLAA